MYLGWKLAMISTSCTNNKGHGLSATLYKNQTKNLNIQCICEIVKNNNIFTQKLNKLSY
jgi:hypothetical protein